MKIAYLISAHKDPQHLYRLIKTLGFSMNGNHFFVHVDEKVDIKPFIIAANNANVHFTEKRVWTIGGVKQVYY